MNTLKRIKGEYIVTVGKKPMIFNTFFDALKFIDKER